ncbi:VP7 [CHeRI orbivirus 3-3]|uniref:Core protein VP7 n=1 Tax=CHeRI orbivirus 3-4 TaxID=2729576 RepID=A0A6M3SMW1_9REOV|nr:VP7 [CHeRI orbivirus 3-1]QCQ85382.1 VP7 [CHeRI orbivirus 3-2]QCQ85392.1 VP7 [CHeRI orbivirus 3-3]QJD38998.1 VP7 [CHeRI orbivirus 3-4]
MEGIYARAFCYLECLGSNRDPRARRTYVPSDGFAQFVTRFNTTSDRPITQTPSTPEEHRACFYAALDLVIAALGLNFNYALPGYSPNVQVLSILARDDLPYSTQAYIRALRIINEPGSGQSTRRFYTPWLDVNFIYPPATPYRTPNDDPQPMAISSNAMEVTLYVNEDVEISDIVMPNFDDVVNACFVWYTLSHYRGAGGALIEGSQMCTLMVGEREIDSGIEFIVPAGAQIRVANQSAVNTGMIHIEMKWFTRAQPTEDIYDTMRLDMAASYSYHTEHWYNLRTYLLRVMGLPPHVMPTEPIRAPNRVLTYALISRLQDAYVAHSPLDLEAQQGGNGQAGLPDAALDALRRA